MHDHEPAADPAGPVDPRWERSSDRPALRVAFGLALRSGRRRAGLSQRELAERAGLSKSAVARIESGAQSVLVESVTAALACVGLRLEIVHDDTGLPWREPEDALEVDLMGLRDIDGRRPPAHLPPEFLTREPYWRFFRREQQIRAGRRRDTLLQPPPPTYRAR